MHEWLILRSAGPIPVLGIFIAIAIVAAARGDRRDLARRNGSARSSRRGGRGRPQDWRQSMDDCVWRPYHLVAMLPAFGVLPAVAHFPGNRAERGKTAAQGPDADSGWGQGHPDPAVTSATGDGAARAP